MEKFTSTRFEKIVRHPIRAGSKRLTVNPMRTAPRWKTPLWGLILAFSAGIGIGTILLMLPISSASSQSSNFIDALFTATSATLVTGLIVQDTSLYWSFFGQAVILTLIQIGGLGYMTGLVFIVMAAGRRVSLNQRKALRIIMGGGMLGKLDLEAKNILLVSIAIQILGIILLLFAFSINNSDLKESLWQSIFHSISAFQNAGFDITGGSGSFTEFRSNPLMMMTITILSFLGGTGINVIIAIILIRRWQPLNLDIKLIVVGFVIVTSTGFLCILMAEWNNPLTLKGVSLSQKLLDTFYLSIGARTSGITSIPMSNLKDYSLFLLSGLMFIGGAAGSMTGGIKLGVFSIIYFSIWSSLKGGSRTLAFKREIPDIQVRRSFAVVAVSVLYIIVATSLLSFFEKAPFIDILFETVSAFGLVGLSTGVTPDLSIMGKIITILSMVMGRLAPVYIALELVRRENAPLYRFPQEDVRIG